MGIRNGGCGGVIPNTIPSALTGLRNSGSGVGVGIRPALASPTMSPNANSHLLTPQRRPLLLQVNFTQVKQNKNLLKEKTN